MFGLGTIGALGGAGMFGGADLMSLGSFGSQLGGLGLGIYNAYNQNQWAQRNYDWQTAQFGYQQMLQSMMFSREDTAIQRRVADLKAAGLSPVLAAGQGASAGPVVSTVTPQRQAPDYQPVAQMMAALVQNVQQIRQSQAQTELTRVQAENANLSKLQILADTEKSIAEKNRTDADTAQRVWDTSIYKRSGMASTDAGLAKQIRSLVDLGVSNPVKGAVKGVADQVKKNWQDADKPADELRKQYPNFIDKIFGGQK